MPKPPAQLPFASLLALLVASTVSGCGDAPPGDCSSGVCGPKGADAAVISLGDGGSADGAAHGDDGGDDDAGASMAGGPSKGDLDHTVITVPPECGTSGPCKEDWSCTPWETKSGASATLPSGDNAGTRSCTDRCNCGTTKNKPAEKATLPPLDFDFYQCEMEPIFDGFCAQMACHGSEKGHRLRVYARSKLRVTGETWTSNVCGDTDAKVKSESCIGSNECRCWQLPHSQLEWQRNYDAARGFALDELTGKPLANMATSELVRSGLSPDAPDCANDSSCLPEGQQALPHAGVVLYSGTGIVYAKMLDWLSQPENGGGKGCVTPSQKDN